MLLAYSCPAHTVIFLKFVCVALFVCEPINDDDDDDDDDNDDDEMANNYKIVE